MSLPPAILVTGAAGNLGRVVSNRLLAKLRQGNIQRLRLADIKAIDLDIPNVECIQTAIDSREAAVALTAGMDAVIHLAGVSVEDEWEALIPANLAAPAWLWEACVAQNVDRVLFASSNHAIGFYPVDTRIDHTAPALPDSRYGITKAFGEELARLYAAKTPVRGFCMRIGSCFAQPSALRHLKTFQTFDDFLRLIEVGLTADYRFEIVYGLSDILDGYWDNSNALRLGYAPQDQINLTPQMQNDRTEYQWQGGSFPLLPLKPIE